MSPLGGGRLFTTPDEGSVTLAWFAPLRSSRLHLPWIYAHTQKNLQNILPFPSIIGTDFLLAVQSHNTKVCCENA